MDAMPAVDVYEVSNEIGVPLYLYAVDSAGVRRRQMVSIADASNPTGKLPANGKGKVPAGDYVALCIPTGGFVCTLTVTTQGGTIKPENVTRPNNIGSFPRLASRNIGKNALTLIPPDSERIVVGWGGLQNGNHLLREQYWKRSPDSFVLAPLQPKLSVGVATSTGMEETSSTENTIATALGLSLSAGWGPVSGSVSASLSTSSTTFQQVTITTRSTQYINVELTNDKDESLVFFRWQLIDTISIFSGDVWTPQASIVVAQAPTLIDGPYSMDQ